MATRNRTWKWLATLAAAAAVASAGSVSAAPAAQADYYGGGLKFSNINIKTVSVDSYWNGVLDRAAQNWNASGAGTRIARTTNSGAYLTAGRYSNQSWYGAYNPFSANTGQTPGTQCVDRVFSIQINAYTIERATTSDKWDVWNLSTTTHEIGHALSLADNPNTSSASLMKHNRDRSVIYKPQTYDIREVPGYNPGC